MLGLRQIKYFFMVLLCLLLLPIAAYSNQPPVTSNLDQFATNHIYIILSRQAQISKIHGGYVLQMKQVHPDILVFTPPPIHKSTIVDIQSFVNIWDSKKALLDRSPPDGAIVFKSFKHINDTDFRSYVLPLYSPQYDAAKDTLTFTIKSASNFDSLLGYHESVALYIE